MSFRVLTVGARTAMLLGVAALVLSATPALADDGSLSPSLWHTCAVKADGSPTCWGDNSAGKSTIPAGTGTVTQIAAGVEHTCVIKTDGTPTCWGRTDEGQTTIPAGTGTVTQISAGEYYTCAIKTDGTPTCWGYNGFGQTAIPGGTGTVTQIAAGDYHTCAIKTDGTPTCWGRDHAGQATIPSGTGTVTQIAAGDYHTCAIKTDGTPTCWGDNTDGQATIPAGTGTLTQITAGAHHTCAIKTDGTPTCWGRVNEGQTTIPAGTGTVTQISAGSLNACAVKTDGTPTCWGWSRGVQTTIPAGTGKLARLQVSAGSSHSCAVRTGGTPACWGNNTYGQSTIPAGTGTVTQVSAGGHHTCAIKTDGTPSCWGYNGFAQATIPAGTGTVTQIVAGDYHTCAIKTDGTPTCWGDNFSGQVTIHGGTVTQITVGESHTCAIRTNGTPACWGYNGDGQATIPAGIGTVTQIVAGDFHTCAIKTDGTPTCWGSNGDGRATVPAGTGTVTRITAGRNHVCAVKTDGSPTCWGLNLYGQTTIPAGTGTVTQISGGRWLTCAVKTAGVAVCWGDNTTGGRGAAPVVTSAPAPPATIGSPYSHTVTASGDPGPTFAVTAGSLPPGLTLDPDSGRITGTPTTPGTYTGTITASNGVFADATQNFSIRVVAAPTIATTASPGITLGAGQLSDTATLSGRVTPVAGSTVSFTLYGPDDATCAGTPAFTSTVPYPVTGGPVSSASFTPTQAGTYRWRAAYSGDENNAPAAGACNDPNANVTVTAVPAVPAAPVPPPAAPLEAPAAPLETPTAPASPLILSGPEGDVTARTATFEFAGVQGASFECSLDAAGFTACVSPMAYSGLARGRHAFAVRQISATGGTSAATQRTFKVAAKATAARTRAKRLRVVAGATSLVSGRRIAVGCQLDRASLRRCTATLTAGGRTIGTGSVTLRKPGTRSATVKITLTAAALEAIQTKSEGTPARISLRATVFGTDTGLAARKRTRIESPTVFVVPTVLLSSPGSTQYLRSLAAQIGKAKTIRCAGHTDSAGTTEGNYTIGLAHAGAVCDFLKGTDLGATTTAVSFGEIRPRAANTTARGQALNGRVEITITR